jgi:2,4-dienoyl-CoA reductase-like NADH-dependent reductase (Old Yellow Enzyme family)
VQLYRRWAASGLGLILTGNVMIDRRALGEPGNVVIEDETDLPVLRQWAQAATGQGAAIWAQLNHPGKQSAKGLNARQSRALGSALPGRHGGVLRDPARSHPAEIRTSSSASGAARPSARRPGSVACRSTARTATWSASSSLPHHNRRNDQWGGSLENRRRFVLAVYAEIRRQVGPDFPVAIKLNSTDFQRGGFTEEESMETIRALVDAGIDLIEISGGTYEAPAMSVRPATNPRRRPPWPGKPTSSISPRRCVPPSRCR